VGYMPACLSCSQHAVSMQSAHHQHATTSIYQHVGVTFMANLTIIYFEQFMLSWHISSACLCSPHNWFCNYMKSQFMLSWHVSS